MNAISRGNRNSLCRCVDSVAKLRSSHEHLIFDGLSSDGTVELLKELSQKYEMLSFRSEKDTGIYNALNKGVSQAKGEWLYVLGDDDYIVVPSVLDRMIANANEGDDELVAPVMEDGTAIPLCIYRPWSLIFHFTPYCHQGVLMRTSVVKRLGGFDERYSIAADYNLMLGMHLAACGIRYFSESFAEYGSQGTSARDDDLRDAEMRQIAARNFNLTNQQTTFLFQSGLLPLFRILKYLFHSDKAIRLAAWQQPVVLMKYIARLLLKRGKK